MAMAGRAMPLMRPIRNSAAPMAAPVLPAETIAQARPSRTASAARTSEESFMVRTLETRLGAHADHLRGFDHLEVAGVAHLVAAADEHHRYLQLGRARGARPRRSRRGHGRPPSHRPLPDHFGGTWPFRPPRRHKGSIATVPSHQNVPSHQRFHRTRTLHRTGMFHRTKGPIGPEASIRQERSIAAAGLRSLSPNGFTRRRVTRRLGPSGRGTNRSCRRPGGAA